MNVREVWEGLFIPLFYFSYRPARRFQHQPRFHQQILWLLLQKMPRICSLLSLHGHHSGPGCHPLSPGSWHQSTLNFHPPVYTPHGSAPTSHHSPAHAGLQSTGHLAVPQTYQALPASRPLYLHCLEYYPPRYPFGGSFTSNRSLLQCLFIERLSQTSLSLIVALSPISFPCFTHLYSIWYILYLHLLVCGLFPTPKCRLHERRYSVSFPSSKNNAHCRCSKNFVEGNFILRNCHTPEEVKETWWLNVMWDLDWDPGTENEH